MYASNAGHPEIVEYLLERGANVNYNKGKCNIVELLSYH